MPRTIMTVKDRDGAHVLVEGGFKAADGQHYLLLRRLPPFYARHPVWLVRLSTDTLVQRNQDGTSDTFYKAYCIQDLTEQEKKFLAGCTAGSSALPFFNFSYPNVIRILGKRFDVLEDTQIGPLLSRVWALIP